jgi:drug/metabolite transporter (DMT)-like permease
MTIYEQITKSALEDKRVTKTKALSNGLLFLGVGIVMIYSPTQSTFGNVFMSITGSISALIGILCFVFLFALFTNKEPVTISESDMSDNIEPTTNPKKKGFLPYNAFGWIWLISTFVLLATLLFILPTFLMESPINIKALSYISGYIGLPIILLATYKTEYLKQPSIKAYLIALCGALFMGVCMIVNSQA